MNLCGSPDLPGFEGGVASPSLADCVKRCATQTADGWERLACQSYTYAMPGFHNNSQRAGTSTSTSYLSSTSTGWCWLRGGRGDAIGKCGYVSAMCDNRPAPASQWPCCRGGYGCPDPIDPAVSKACQEN